MTVRASLRIFNILETRSPDNPNRLIDIKRRRDPDDFSQFAQSVPQRHTFRH